MKTQSSFTRKKCKIFYNIIIVIWVHKEVMKMRDILYTIISFMMYTGATEVNVGLFLFS